VQQPGPAIATATTAAKMTIRVLIILTMFNENSFGSLGLVYFFALDLGGDPKNCSPHDSFGK